jgi:hypothetical protein
MRGIAFLILIAIIGALAANGSHNDKTTAATPAAAQTAATAEKKEEPPPPTPRPGEDFVNSKFFSYLKSKAGFNCQQAIKRLVKYDIRSPGVFSGTNSGDSVFFLLRFEYGSKVVASDNTVIIAGESAEVQNGFGNWVRANYSCTVNVENFEVTFPTLDTGKL